MTTLQLPPIVQQLQPLFQRERRPVYLVGGTLRDLLLGRAHYDLDFAIAERAIGLAFRVGDRLGAPAFVLDQERDIGRVIYGDLVLDFAAFRGDGGDESAALLADLHARDFTINALALAVNDDGSGPIIDPTGGVADLHNRILRQTHAKALASDPLRALRGVRLAQTLALAVDDATAAELRRMGDELWRISPERIRDEFIKILSAERPDAAVAMLQQYELLGAIAPELPLMIGVTQTPPHSEDVFGHTLSVLRWLAELEKVIWEQPSALSAALASSSLTRLRPHFERQVDGGLSGLQLLRLGALFHDSGKPQTRSVDESGRIRFFRHETAGATIVNERLRHLRASREAIGHVGAIVQGHLRPLLLAGGQKQPTRRAIYRYFKKTKSAGLDICVLSLADNLAKRDGPSAEWRRLLATVERMLSLYFDAYETVVAPPQLLRGQEIIALGVPAGPRIGQILRRIEEGQAAGEITSRDEALELAQRLIQVMS